jgi:putative addiction module killer protein
MTQYKIQLQRTLEFDSWLNKQTAKTVALIEARLARIELYAHFGDVKYLGQKIAELRWANGLRVYFSKLDNIAILILVAGEKHEQKKCIKRAKILFQQYASS